MSFPVGLLNALQATGLEYAFQLVFVGMIGLGILNLRHPLMGPWRWLPLATGIFGFIGFVMLGGETITAWFLLCRTLFALGLVAMGVGLWRGSPYR